MKGKQQSRYVPPTISYVTFRSNFEKLALFLGTTEELLDKHVRILKWRVRVARRGLPELERQMDGFLKKYKLSKAAEKRFNEIGSKVEDLADIDIFVPIQIKLLHQFPELIRIFGLIYLVAVFEGYLSDIVREMLLTHPEALKSSRQLTAEEVLAQGGKKQIVSYLVEKEIDDLLYKSFPDVIKYFNEKFRINLNDSEVPTEDIVEIQATRNIHIHNKGVVNQHFQKLVKDHKLRPGAYKRITREYLQYANNCIATLVGFIDTEARNKYFAR